MSRKFEPTEKYWTAEAADVLVGKTVKSVRYMTDEEADNMGWFSRPVVVTFTDGSLMFASRDDEGNDGGVIFGQAANGDEFTLPVLSLGFDKG